MLSKTSVWNFFIQLSFFDQKLFDLLSETSYNCRVTVLLHPVDPGGSNVCQVTAIRLCSGPPINVNSWTYDLKLVGLDLPIGEALTGIVQSWAAVHHILRP